LQPGTRRTRNHSKQKNLIDD
jgi:hypothetical protein